MAYLNLIDRISLHLSNMFENVPGTLNNVKSATMKSFNENIPRLTEVPRQGVHSVFQVTAWFITLVAQTVAIVVFYIYLKNFRGHSSILMEGYVALFKTFAEFVSAIICLTYGIMEMELFYTIVGIAGIAIGLCQKAMIHYNQTISEKMKNMTIITTAVSIGSIALVLLCGFCFHEILTKTGFVYCATRFFTCVLPLMALSESFYTKTAQSYYFSYVCDLASVALLWWYCVHLSIKYFIIFPSIIGLTYTGVRFLLEELQKWLSRENERDLYK